MGAWADRALPGARQRGLACLVALTCLVLPFRAGAVQASPAGGGPLASHGFMGRTVSQDPTGAGHCAAGPERRAAFGARGGLGDSAAIGLAGAVGWGGVVPGGLPGGALRLRGGGRIRLRFRSGLPGSGKGYGKGKDGKPLKGGRSGSPKPRSGSPTARSASVVTGGRSASKKRAAGAFKGKKPEAEKKYRKRMKPSNLGPAGWMDKIKRPELQRRTISLKGSAAARKKPSYHFWTKSKIKDYITKQMAYRVHVRKQKAARPLKNFNKGAFRMKWEWLPSAYEQELLDAESTRLAEHAAQLAAERRAEMGDEEEEVAEEGGGDEEGGEDDEKSDDGGGKKEESEEDENPFGGMDMSF